MKLGGKMNEDFTWVKGDADSGIMCEGDLRWHCSRSLHWHCSYKGKHIALVYSLQSGVWQVSGCGCNSNFGTEAEVMRYSEEWYLDYIMRQVNNGLRNSAI